MSSQPQEHETCTVDLSYEERWVVHHVLITRADEVLDDRDAPPEWLPPLVELIESDDETFTYHQARTLHETVSDYAAATDTPERDVEPAATVTATLEAVLEAV